MQNPKSAIRNPPPHSRSGGSAERRHCGVQARGALPSRRYDRKGTGGRTIIPLCFLLSALCFPAWGQYAIDWSTIDGGGGTSTGGVYSVTGTIGQPDAGTMSGGNYTLQGGFWGVVAAVQTPGAPFLTIARTTTNTVVVSWPLPAEGWVLQATNALPNVATTWPVIPPPYQTNGPNLHFIELAPAGNRLYRLHKP